ncbi:MAG TPA: VIT1/CCC1 transporter family protein [Atribacterota bacterium]|nr:VIT1/CCC1 transporter family protein [Atribacterota bacterium]
MDNILSEKEVAQLKKAQQDELVGEQVYGILAKLTKDTHNSKILARISNEEKKHAEIFKQYTKTDLPVDRFKVFFYVFISRVFGLTFGIKLQEKGEQEAQKNYKEMLKVIPEMKEIIEDEEKHEIELINMIYEEKLSYMSSVVLGLNDALVELTGALAGFTLSVQNSRIIAFLGLITGISASLSMAASEYLSTKAEQDPEAQKRAGKSALYTGIAYILTVIALIIPYFLSSNYILSLIATVIVALTIIFVFNYYISVANDYDFKRRFAEMALISMGVAALSFLIGHLVNTFLGFEL